MSVEAGDNISNLNILWPIDTDPTHEGNDHLWLVKRVLQKTFAGRAENGNPEGGYTIPVTARAEELNHLEGVDSDVQPALDSKALKIYLDKETGPDQIVMAEDGTDTHIRTTDDKSLHQSWNSGAQTATVLNTTNMFDFIYPIGSVIFSMDDNNPTTRWPSTTWVSAGDGRYLASTGSHTDVNGTGKTLAAGDISEGEYRVLLAMNEMPAHHHGIATSNDSDGSGQVAAGATQTGSKDTGDTGGSTRHNNMPPGFALYVWQRTA